MLPPASGGNDRGGARRGGPRVAIVDIGSLPGAARPPTGCRSSVAEWCGGARLRVLAKEFCASGNGGWKQVCVRVLELWETELVFESWLEKPKPEQTHSDLARICAAAEFPRHIHLILGWSQPDCGGPARRRVSGSVPRGRPPQTILSTDVAHLNIAQTYFFDTQASPRLALQHARFRLAGMQFDRLVARSPKRGGGMSAPKARRRLCQASTRVLTPRGSNA